MTSVAEFALESGVVLTLSVTIAASLFRSASVSFALKLIIPSLMLAISIAAPWRIGALLGQPRPVACSDLPKTFNLIAFLPNGESADLFIQAGGPPRLYEVEAGADFRAALAKLKPKLARGPVTLKRHCGDDDDQERHGPAGEDSPTGHGEQVFEEVNAPKKATDE